MNSGKWRSISWDTWGAVGVLAALVVSLGIFARHWLPDPNIWFDESGQYWLSRGLNHDSPLDAAPQWLGAGVMNGMTGYNLDPPGFTVGLGLVVRAVGSSATSLRLLPFLAYIATFAVAYLIGRRVLGLPRTISLGLPPLALTAALPLHYSTEIRAYSAELLAVTATLLTTAILVRTRSTRGAIPFLFTLFFGLLAPRYYFAIAAASSAAVYAIAFAMDRQRKARIRQGLVVVLGYLVVGVAAAWSIGVFGPSEQLGYGQGYAQGGESLRTSGALLTTLRTNLVDGGQWPVGVFLLMGLVLLVFRVVAGRRRGGRSPRPAWVLLWAMVLSYETAALTVAYVAEVPWDAGSRWSIGLWAIAAASVLGLAAQVAGLLKALPNRPLYVALRAVALLLVVGATVVSLVRLVTYERPESRVAGSRLITLMESYVNPHLTTQWAVDYWSWPAFRWLVRESGLWPSTYPVEHALPVGDGVLINANWPDVIPQLSLCPPGQQTVVIHEQSNANFFKRTGEITGWAQQQHCRVTTVPISSGEVMLVLSPANG